MPPLQASAAANNTDANQREAAISALSTRSSAGLFHSPPEALFHCSRAAAGRMDYRPCGAAASPAGASLHFTAVRLDGVGFLLAAGPGPVDDLPQAHDRFVVGAFARQDEPQCDEGQVGRFGAQHFDAAIE